jgi:hypothetical protein
MSITNIGLSFQVWRRPVAQRLPQGGDFAALSEYLTEYFARLKQAPFDLDCSPAACGAVFPDGGDEGDDDLSEQASHFYP